LRQLTTRISCCAIPPIAGAVGLCRIPRTNTGALTACYYVAQVLSGIQPLLYTWANSNAGGSTKRVVTFATMFVFQCAGNIIGPQVYFAREAPYYHTGLYVNIGCWSVLILLICIQRVYLGHLNKKQAARRVAMGLPEELEDMSIMTYEEAQKYKEQLTAQMAAAGLDIATLYENAFDDMTDFENPAFIYVL
jgi:hypothetical protein